MLPPFRIAKGRAEEGCFEAVHACSNPLPTKRDHEDRQSNIYHLRSATRANRLRRSDAGARVMPKQATGASRTTTIHCSASLHPQAVAAPVV